jgi:hypothetical protein
MSKKPSTVLDPELQRQLGAADKDQPIEAVFTLRTPEVNPLLEEKEVQQIVQRIVKSAQDSSGQQVNDLYVMPRAQSFSLAAPAGVVRAILERAEISSAMANVQSEEMAINPVSRSREKSTTRGGGKPRKGTS